MHNFCIKNKEVFYVPKSSFEKHFQKICHFFLIVTTEKAYNFDTEKLYFLTGLDTPNTPSTHERASRETILSNEAPLEV